MVGLLGVEVDWRSVSGRVVSVLVTYVEDELVSRLVSVDFVYIDDGLTRSTPFRLVWVPFQAINLVSVLALI
jgi:hypothetical protein